ncbi:hypothetical protein [Pseudonocardia sp. 73-21]|jgi:drug/metabolite transporter (DMT)-like permease|uniref:hypothetical protein n=1 Tax=Pseudonocardia sp. 73-21 TaxID=1895809 RepID=UPI00095D34F7|nr:hypothetical protein [Pseudonocardia sp. 73-21]OJY50073.1 MAG: hypothetical protein BGP03_24675 [Pseudonocardia sp. 73-21]
MSDLTVQLSSQLTATVPVLAIGLAVAASVGFAGAAVLQHRAVAAQTDTTSDDASSDALSLRGMRDVSKRPGWLLGLALAAGGSTLHAVALVLAPLSVVQPVGVLAVPIAVVLTAIGTRRRPAAGVLVGVAVCVAGVAAFVGTAAGTAVSTPAPNGATLFAGLVVAGIVLLLAVLGYARTGWLRCVFCAMAGAVAFGLVSALVRAVSQTITSGESSVLDPAVIATVFGVVVALVAGGWLVQQAFASGPPEVVVACLTVVDPIVAVLLGVVLLGEGAHTPAGTWALLITAGLVATAGVVALARHHPDAAARSGAPSPSRSSISTRRSDLLPRR